jgi:hypothetical protein
MRDNHAEPLAAIYPREARVDFQRAQSGELSDLQSTEIRRAL